MSELAFCDDCRGYTHMPWCPNYTENVSSEPESPGTDPQAAFDNLHSVVKHDLAAFDSDWKTAPKEMRTVDERELIRAAVLDAIDGSEWHFVDDDGDAQAEHRVNFADKVCALIADLQTPPFDYARNDRLKAFHWWAQGRMRGYEEAVREENEDLKEMLRVAQERVR